MTTHARAKPPKIIGLIIKEPMEWIKSPDNLEPLSDEKQFIVTDGKDVGVGRVALDLMNTKDDVYMWEEAYYTASHVDYEKITHYMNWPTPPQDLDGMD